MTMHVCKGLEWPVVAVVTSADARKAQDAEQNAMLEARLVYVAATRAMDTVIYF